METATGAIMMVAATMVEAMMETMRLLEATKQSIKGKPRQCCQHE
jgi:hypothetical protein